MALETPVGVDGNVSYADFLMKTGQEDNGYALAAYTELGEMYRKDLTLELGLDESEVRERIFAQDPSIPRDIPPLDLLHCLGASQIESIRAARQSQQLETSL